MIQFLGVLDLLAAGLLAGTAYNLPLAHGLIVAVGLKGLMSLFAS